MRVRATAQGYDNVTVREPGDEFEMPEGSTAPWFEPVDKKKNGKQQQSQQNEKGDDLG